MGNIAVPTAVGDPCDSPSPAPLQPALSGLVVCAADGGVTTSWGARPCPRKGAVPVTDVSLRTVDDAGAHCVVVPDGVDALLASAPALRAVAVVAVPAPHAACPLPTGAAVASLDGSRGPPSSALGALRTIVLRV